MQTNRSKGTTKSVREGAACPCLHRYRFRVRQGVHPWTVVRLIFPRWWPSPRVPTKFLRQQEGGRNKNSQALPSKSRWECFLLRIRFEEWENVMYRMVDTMTMRTLCRAQICLRVCVCGGGIYEKELWFCDSRCYTSIAVSCSALCVLFVFYITRCWKGFACRWTKEWIGWYRIQGINTNEIWNRCVIREICLDVILFWNWYFIWYWITMIIVSFQFITILVHVFYNVNKGLDTFLFLVSFTIFLDRMENWFLNTWNYKRNMEGFVWKFIRYWNKQQH